MRTSVRLSIRCSEKEVRTQLESVLSPDNEGAPKGLRFSMSGRAGTLLFRIESAAPSAGLSTAIAVLRDVSLFQEVWLLSRRKDA